MHFLNAQVCHGYIDPAHPARQAVIGRVDHLQHFSYKAGVAADNIDHPADGHVFRLHRFLKTLNRLRDARRPRPAPGGGREERRAEKHARQTTDSVPAVARRG